MIKLIIDGIEIIIEKDVNIKTDPINQHPIHYNEKPLKRIYYKKGDPEYHRKPIKTISRFLGSDKIVKQEPLLDPYY